MKKYKLLNKIGSGSFGSIYMCNINLINQVKIFKINNFMQLNL